MYFCKLRMRTPLSREGILQIVERPLPQTMFSRMISNCCGMPTLPPSKLVSVKDTLSIRINIFGLSSVLRIYLILMWIPILDPTGKTLIWILDSTVKKGSGFWIPLGKMDPDSGSHWEKMDPDSGSHWKKWIRILDPTGKNGFGFWIPLEKMDPDSKQNCQIIFFFFSLIFMLKLIDHSEIRKFL